MAPTQDAHRLHVGQATTRRSDRMDDTTRTNRCGGPLRLPPRALVAHPWVTIRPTAGRTLFVLLTIRAGGDAMLRRWIGVPLAICGLLSGQALLATSASAGLSYTGKFKTTGTFALSGPYALTTDADRNTYVADTSNYRMVKFAPDGHGLLIF